MLFYLKNPYDMNEVENNVNLKNFYENTYLKNESILKDEIIPYKKYPVNKYEACIKYFTDNFENGSILDIGAGDGMIAKSILHHNKSVTKYLATDFSENSLNATRLNVTDSRLSIKNVDVEMIQSMPITAYCPAMNTIITYITTLVLSSIILIVGD